MQNTHAERIDPDIHELLRCKAAFAILKHSKSADLLRKLLLSHVWRVPSSKVLSCKHERLFDLLVLISTNCSAAKQLSQFSNIRNPLIYCVNRYFLMFDGSRVQKSYRASTNDFLTF